jgi:hypothetical protein
MLILFEWMQQSQGRRVNGLDMFGLSWFGLTVSHPRDSLLLEQQLQG